MKDITLEAVEEVMSRAGVGYPEAKAALLAAGGEVEKAVSDLQAIRERAEELRDEAYMAAEELKDGAFEAAGEAKKTVEEVVEKLKEAVKTGNVDRIQIRRGEDVLLNIPVNVGLIGGAIGLAAAPWAMIAAAVAAFGFSCRIEIVKKDGKLEEI